MASIRLGLVQMNSVAGDVESNVNKAVGQISTLAKLGIDLVVLPEFFNTEYFFQYRDYGYLDYAEREDGLTISAIRAAAKANNCAVCATILEEEGPGLYYDTALLIDSDGETIMKYRKTHPAAVTSLEKIYFRAGNRFPVIRFMGINIGIVICYDLLFPESARCLTVNGAELILVPFAAQSEQRWDSLMATRAWENGVYIAACNKVGPEAGEIFGGRSLIADPYGNILKRASDEDEGTLAITCLLYTSPSPRDGLLSRMPSSA